MVEDEQAGELKKLFNKIRFVKSVEEKYPHPDEPNTKYIKIKNIMDDAKGKGPF
jgi:hypothetical protein